MSYNGSGSSHGSNGEQAAGGQEQQLQPPNNQLPRSSVVRMMRQVLAVADDARVSTPAKNLTQSCAARFIKAVIDVAAKRRDQDVAWALRSLGLDRFVEPMETYLRRYREAAASDDADGEQSQILARMMSETGGGNNDNA